MEINMTEIKELTEAIRGLTAAITGTPAVSAPAVPVAAPAPLQPVPATQPAVQVPTQPAVPVAAAPAYTLEQLSLAARQLADAGRMADVQQLVAQFGAQTMAQLPVDRYGEFATALRGMGARI